MPSCDNATGQLPPFGRTYLSSVVRAAWYTSHQHGSTSETQVPIKRERWNELGSKRRQRQGNALNFDRIESLKRSVVVVEALCLWVFFSEYVTACISLDLSVFHCDCVTVEGGFRWGSNNPPEHVFSPNLILYFPWTRKSEQKAPATLQKPRHNIQAHNIAYATRIKFSFSTMHFQQSTQRTSKMGLGEVKRRKDRQKEKKREAQNEVTLERNQKLERSNRNWIMHSGN